MMTKKEKIKMFIHNTNTLSALRLLYGIYENEILYDNELCDLYFKKRRSFKTEFNTRAQWDLCDLN